MQVVVYRVIGVLCAVVAGTPIGTNLGLVHLLWMLVSGRLLASRGAVIPGLLATGLSEPAVRRAWAAIGTGGWSSQGPLAAWQRHVVQTGSWRAHAYEGYRPVPVDVTGFWRPWLQGCATRHYHGPAGRALPAIPVGIVARVGSVGTQRLGLPLALVRAELTDPSTAAHERALLAAAVQAATDRDALVCDAGFEIRQLQDAGATAYVVRAAKNITGRRAVPPPYPGRGRPRWRGELIRPLARTYRGRPLAATPPDQAVTWQEGDAIIRAEWWDDLVLADVPPDRPTFRLVAIHDLRWTEPLVLATTLPISARALRDLYLDRWTVEHGFRFLKHHLGWTTVRPSHPHAADRWTWLLALALWQLWLARPLVCDQRLPWERPLQPHRLTPARVRRALATLFSHVGTPTRPVRPRGNSPGRQLGQRPAPRPRFPTALRRQNAPPNVRLRR